jgi:hypothetical protein
VNCSVINLNTSVFDGGFGNFEFIMEKSHC